MSEPTYPPMPPPPMLPQSQLQNASGKKIAAGVCGILLGGFGVHKFILGMTTPGIIMLLVTVLSCGVAYPLMHVIGLIEGIIYLLKTDVDFYQTYIAAQKEWF